MPNLTEVFNRPTFLAPILGAACTSLKDFFRIRFNAGTMDTVDHFINPTEKQLRLFLTSREDILFMGRIARNGSAAALNALVNMFEGQKLLPALLEGPHLAGIADSHFLLKCAVRWGTPTAVKILLDAYVKCEEESGPDFLKSAHQSDGHCVFGLAIHFNKLDVLKLLTQYNGTMPQEVLEQQDQILLRHTVDNNNLEMLQWLRVQLGAPGFQKMITKYDGAHLYSSLKIAAYAGHLDMFQFLCMQYDESMLQNTLSAHKHIFLKTVALNPDRDMFKFALEICKDKPAAIEDLKDEIESFSPEIHEVLAAFPHYTIPSV